MKEKSELFLVGSLLISVIFAFFSLEFNDLTSIVISGILYPSFIYGVILYISVRLKKDISRSLTLSFSLIFIALCDIASLAIYYYPTDGSVFAQPETTQMFGFLIFLQFFTLTFANTMVWVVRQSNNKAVIL